MTNPRIILNKLKWHENKDIKKAEIWYVHRGAPQDTKIIQGNEVIDLGISFFKTNNAQIPYHRIFLIKYNDKIIFKR